MNFRTHFAAVRLEGGKKTHLIKFQWPEKFPPSTIKSISEMIKYVINLPKELIKKKISKVINP